MLFLTFRLGSDRYALDVSSVAEVLPLVGIKKIPQAPKGVAGVFNYRGAPVPVIDLSDLILDKPSRSSLSTRIILVHDGSDPSDIRMLGLIAEQATETVRRDAGDFVSSGVRNDAAPYLGPLTTDARELMQQIDVETLLPASIKSALFARVREL